MTLFGVIQVIQVIKYLLVPFFLKKSSLNTTL
jgi:hypothetical protein